MPKLGKKLRVAIGVVAAVAVLILGGLFFLLGRTRVVQVTEDVHVLRTGNGLSDIGANVVVFTGDDGLLLVDTQLKAFSRRMVRLVAGNWHVPIETIVNTHWHPDHTGGNASLGKGASIVAHASVRERMSSEQEGFGLTKPGSHHTFGASPPEALPTVLVSDTLTLSLGSRRFLVRHTPHAHTDGDVILYAEDAGVLVVGDLVWPASFPFVDTHNGGSAILLSGALRDILAWLPAGSTIVPGHGDPMTTQDLAAYSDMVEQTIRIVRGWHDSGMSLEDAQTQGLPEPWNRWSSKLVPASEWVGMVYRSLDAAGSPSDAG